MKRKREKKKRGKEKENRERDWKKKKEKRKKQNRKGWRGKEKRENKQRRKQREKQRGKEKENKSLTLNSECAMEFDDNQMFMNIFYNQPLPKKNHKNIFLLLARKHSINVCEHKRFI